MASDKKTKKQHPKKINIIGRFFAKSKAFLTDFWPIIFLILITSLICFLNYESGTYLSGWDNLHPEFNSALYLKRSLFAVWQEYQSTGLLGGMAHAADLPRVILIYLISLGNLVPVNLIRYATTFAPLLLGPIGVYLLISNILTASKLSHKTIQISSFLAGLYYLLNLSTLQTFFIPFETFTWFYGALPFLIYFTLQYLKQPKISNFLYLFFVSFFSGTSFYVETIFLVFLLCLAPFLVEKLFKTKKYLRNLWSVFSASVAVILPHLFWLLPVIFFVFTNGHVTTQNHINSISSVETYYRNLEFANPKSLLLLHGYLFKYLDLGLNNSYDLLLGPWQNHLNSSLITIIGLFFVITSLLGIYYAFHAKINYRYSFLSILIGCSFFLLGGGILINNSLPLIGELFRSPYTKFSIPLVFSLSYFFAIGVVFILDIFAFLDTRLTYNLTLFTFSFLLFTYMSPAFSGNFINKNMRVNIPTEYFDLFSYLNSKPADLRIANFPQHTFWGWNYYNWGHRGSGFIWYGLKQPVLDRAFDVWEKTSQSYYEEIATALYSQDHNKFNEVIDKYNVAYLLIDTSVIAPDTKATTGINYLDQILATTNQYELEKSFGQNLYLYKNKNHQTKDYISVAPPSDIRELKTEILDFSQRPNQEWYQKAGFINTNINLSTLSDPTDPTDSATALADSADSADSLPTLLLPSLTQSENLLPYRVEFRPNGSSVSLRFTPITPVFFLDEKQIDLDYDPQIITFPVAENASKLILSLNSQYFSFDLPSEVPSASAYSFLAEVYLPTKKSFPLALYLGVPTYQYPIINSLTNSNPVQCYTNKENRQIEKISTPRSVTILGTDLVGCLSAPLPPVNNDQLLAVSFTYYSPTLTTANVNISNENFGTQNSSQPFESSLIPKRAQIFTKPSPQNQQVNLILEAEDTKTIQEITYKDVYISAHDTIYQTDLKLSPIKEKTINLSPNKENQLQISLPITKTSYNVIQTPSTNSLFPENRNCDRFNNGKTIKITKEDHIVYQSQNAIECDYLNLRHLPHSVNYLIGFDVKNILGIPMVTCLENHATRRCDVYERLRNISGQQYLLQPINNPSEQNGFTLHFFNQSFGNRIGENHLNSITIHPFPLNFLQNISLSHGAEPADKYARRADYAEITSSTHPAEFLYTLTTTRSPALPAGRLGEVGLLQLNLYQTRSPYWQAFILPDEYQNLNPWQLTLKILLNYKNLNKLEPINNSQWYNSWTTPVIASEANQSIHITIAYLPQYLEFFGLIIIILVPLLILPFLLYQKLNDKK